MGDLRARVAAALVALAAGAAAGHAAADGALAPLELPDGVRAVVVAPHPDDEVLAAGGLIARLVARGDAVDVVFVTSGDGYAEAAGLPPDACPQDAWAMRELGATRQAEARTADARLGLGPAHLHFLGFPDDALPALWAEHWTTPLVSPHTGAAAADAAGVEAPGVPYTGAALVETLGRLLGRLRPTLVLIADPRDSHGDHAHAGLFALRALAALPARPRVITYLVHDPSWPPDAPETEPLPAPGGERFRGTRWLTLVLTPGERIAKTAALDAYRTQLAVMPQLLYHLLRPNEVFGEPPPEGAGRPSPSAAGSRPAPRIRA